MNNSHSSCPCPRSFTLMPIADTRIPLLLHRAPCFLTLSLVKMIELTFRSFKNSSLRPFSPRLKRHSRTNKEIPSRRVQHLHQPNWKKCRRMYEETGTLRLLTSSRSLKATTQNKLLKSIHASSLPYLVIGH